MSNYNSLKTAIDANIKQNGKQEITGPVLNSVLNAMVDTLGAGYQFAGIAVSDTNPGTPDAKVFYIANGKGAYTNFSGLDVTEDEVVVLYYDTEWHKVSTGIASQAKLSELQTTIDSKQDTISDLDDIREGAELGKTALQEHQDISGLATKKEVATKQDKISDLDTIRSGAAKGATALQSYTETDPIYTADKPSIALKSELDGKQDKLTAGDNITIVNNVISSTGGGGGSVDLSAYAKTEDVNAGLATKQDKISDLATIREGAAKGATALQSETDPIYSADKPSLALKSELNGKQDTISDLESIREGAALGKTALQEHQDISKLATKEEVATKQDTISDLATIRSGAAKGATALQSYTESDPIYTADKPSLALKSEIPDISGKQDKISDLDTIRSGAAKGATALQSYTETDPIYMADKPSIALKSEIPDISGKADKTLIVTETEGNSSYSIAPNRLTRLGTLASSLTLSLNTASEESGVANIYDIIFTTPTNAPSITWPEGITWVGGSAPAIAGGKTYEVNIMDNLATYGEF